MIVKTVHRQTRRITLAAALALPLIAATYAKLCVATHQRHPRPRIRHPEAAGRTPPQSPIGGPAAEGTPRRAAIKAIEARSTA
jgi:hypothetical protein